MLAFSESSCCWVMRSFLCRSVSLASSSSSLLLAARKVVRACAMAALQVSMHVCYVCIHTYVYILCVIHVSLCAMLCVLPVRYPYVYITHVYAPMLRTLTYHMGKHAPILYCMYVISLSHMYKCIYFCYLFPRWAQSSSAFAVAAHVIWDGALCWSVIKPIMPAVAAMNVRMNPCVFCVQAHA